jgi:hypothetical protein
MDTHLTRRSLLAGGAGALAAGMLRPPAGDAATAAIPETRLDTVHVGEVPAGGLTLELPAPADLLGLSWDGNPGAHIRLRFRGAAGRWSPWVSAGSRGHGPEGAVDPARTVGEPIWTGGASAVQVMASGPLAGVAVHIVDVSGGVGARPSTAQTASLALAKPSIDAGAGQPPIIARRSWALGMSPPRVAPEYGAVRMAFVHHTENPNGYGAAEVPGMLRAIYAFHTYTNGWNDIGYNFVIDLYGRIFEARAGGIQEAVIGAHAGGYNYVSTGVSVLGTFSYVPISTAARHALQSLLAWKLPLHGVPAQGTIAVRVDPSGAQYSKYPGNARVVLPRIAGHRDGDSTECPGDVLYGELPSIRPAVRRLAGSGARLTLILGAQVPAGTPAASEPGGATAPATTTPATPTAPAQQRLEGTLTLPAGAPAAGAGVIVQSRTVSRRGELVTETTLAEVQTGAQGQWSALVPVPAAPAPAQHLRALFAGGSGLGATVSEGLTLPAAAAVK